MKLRYEHFANKLGSLYEDQGRYAKAEPLLADCLDTLRQVLPAIELGWYTGNDILFSVSHRGDMKKRDLFLLKIFV